MNTRRLIAIVLITPVITVLVTAALLGFIPGVIARTATAGSAQHFSLLAEAMQPVDSSIGYDNYQAFLKTTQESTVSIETTYVGQVNLPDGATIVGVRCFGQDSDPNREFYFRLYRYNLEGDPVWSAVTDFAYSGVAFSGGKLVVEATVDPSTALVDNTLFSYGIYVVLPKATSGDLGLLRCVVDASYAVSLPLVPANHTAP